MAATTEEADQDELETTLKTKECVMPAIVDNDEKVHQNGNTLLDPTTHTNEHVDGVVFDKPKDPHGSPCKVGANSVRKQIDMEDDSSFTVVKHKPHENCSELNTTEPNSCDDNAASDQSVTSVEMSNSKEHGINNSEVSNNSSPVCDNSSTDHFVSNKCSKPLSNGVDNKSSDSDGSDDECLANLAKDNQSDSDNECLASIAKEAVKNPLLNNVKNVPRKARKSAFSLIKTVNLAPIANVTIPLAEVEQALKCDKALDSVSIGTSDGQETEEDRDISNVESGQEQDAAAKKIGKILKRKKKMGTYNFPSSKKLKKKKVKTDSDATHSGAESAMSNNMECEDSAANSTNEDTCPSVDSKSDAGNPQCEGLGAATNENLPANALDVLSRNSHLAFKPKSRSMTARKKINDGSPYRGKTVMQLLNETNERKKRQIKALSGRTHVENNLQLAANTTHGTDGFEADLDESREGCDSDAERNGVRKTLRKRKSPDPDDNGLLTSHDAASDMSVCSSDKKPRSLSGEFTPKIPIITVVTSHQPQTPGLRSILPKPPLLSSQLDLTSSVAQARVNQSIVPVNAASDFSIPSTRYVAVKNLDSQLDSLPSEHYVAITKIDSPQPSQDCSAIKDVSLPSQNCGALKNSDALRALLTCKQSSIPTELGHSSSKFSSLGHDAKLMSTPNGLCYPVTPPKTPEDGAIGDDGSQLSSSAAVPGSVSPDRSIIPLCCCKLNGASFTKLDTKVLYCQALDSVDGKILGCCNKVSNSQLVRPAVKIPFMAICENHRKRLKLHQCCPGCGHFCVRGKFYQCRKDSAQFTHSFHQQCQVFKDSKLFCPHCGEESSQYEVNISTCELQTMTMAENIQKGTEYILRKQQQAANRAKMTVQYPSLRAKESDSSVNTSLVSHMLPSSKTISSANIPLGPDRLALEKIITHLDQERPKKYRNLPKSLYQPSIEGDLEKVVYMLMDGADPNQKYEEYDDETPLHAAAYNCHLAVLHVLIQAGASSHMKDKKLKTPLMYAAERNNLSCVQYLVKAGADVKEMGEDGMSCLHYAAKSGNIDIIKYLIETAKMDPNIQDDGGWTPIIWAAESQFLNVVRYLMYEGADPKVQDNEENTGLHWAAYSGNVDITELFIEAGCDINSPNEHGDRPLHISARQDHYECIVLLLARGADVECRNNEGDTALTCIIDQSTSSWMALKVNKQLRAFGAKLGRIEKLIHRDIAYGREKNPIACTNAVDDESFPTDYLYVNENIETTPLNINRTLTSLQSCRCKDDCSSLFCVCARSSVKCWYDKLGHLLPDTNLVEPPLVFECNRACRCWTNCNNRVVQNGITVRLQLFKTSGRGWGVKTLQDIPKGKFVCEYIGELISDSEADRREDDSYLFDLDNRDGETYCIDARKYGNISRFINHLCEPNLIPVKVFIDHQDLRFPRICFFSSRDIKAHEELGFDYGEKFWIIKWKQFTCACSNIKCKYSSETIHKTLEDYRRRHLEEEITPDT
ncbi:histone-lysine N-methyltransferase EHMT2-like [Gigantopelta aegis]|uniref:histone-lysine N-methyltransferase EHMT2-like n=1 Tax=Gigantopelta aegis TaxID=1735272 RepID=UPI001B88B145|nr:histone-lysine N-methyltransferase EHMT2-like [Gigantopelta aegis]